jgi:hypothetical protein
MHSSAIRLQLETLHLRLVEGEAVDSGELICLSTELRGLTPEAALKVEVIYIDGTFDICPSCGHTQPAVEKPPPAPASPVA